MDDVVTVGMGFSEAKAAAAAYGYTLRVIAEADSDEGGFATGDLRQDRLNVEVEDGVVVRVVGTW